MILKFFVTHWMGRELAIPGVYEHPLGDAPPSSSPSYDLEIEESDLGVKLNELSKTYDVMLVRRKDQLVLRLDDQGRHFAQR